MDEDEVSYLPFVGNGFLGIPLIDNPSVYMKDERTLSLNIKWNPIVSVQTNLRMKETYITYIKKGTVIRLQCLSNGIQVIYKYYAHRTIPYLFYQEIKIVNPTKREIKLELSKHTSPDWVVSSMEDRIDNYFYTLYIDLFVLFCNF